MGILLGRPDRLYKYIRRQRRLWHARPWLNDIIGHVSLGQYPTESAAHQAIVAWVKAGCHLDRDLPPGVLPKWVHAKDDGTYGCRFRFAGRKVIIRSKGTPGEAFQCARAAVDRIRERDGWLRCPLPPGVVVRAAGYAVRYWHRDRVFVEAGPFRSPREAAAVLPVGAGRAA